MVLFNKLIVIDLLLFLAFVLFFILQTDRWKDLIPGFAAAMLIFSIVNHSEHFKETKKLY